MKSQFLVHQNNRVSFSYTRTKMTKSNLHKYIQSKLNHEVDPFENPHFLVQHDPSHYLHIVKDGIYHLDNRNMVNTFCSINDLHRSYYQSNDLYFFILKHLRLNLFSINLNFSILPLHVPIQYVSSTYYPSKLHDVNLQDYYKIFIKHQHVPLYLRMDNRLYDESGSSRKLSNIIHSLGRRRIMGLNQDHQPQVFEIEKAKNVSAEDETQNFDTPFFSIGLKKESIDPKTIPSDYVTSKTSILVGQVLVDLD
jgi:hypothetical protein